MELFINGELFFALPHDKANEVHLACFQKNTFSAIKILKETQTNLRLISFIRRILRPGGEIVSEAPIDKTIFAKSGMEQITECKAKKPKCDEEYEYIAISNPWKAPSKLGEAIEENKLLTPIVMVETAKCEGKTKCENCTCGKLVYRCKQ